MRIIYGLDTESIEDFSQCVVADLPDDLDGMETEDYLREHPVTVTPVVAWSDVVNALHDNFDQVDGFDADYIARRLAEAIGLTIIDDNETDTV